MLHAFSRAGNVVPCRHRLAGATQINVGMDLNINPMSATILIEEDGIDYQVDEVVLQTSNTDEIVEELRSRFARDGMVGHITVYPDPAGAQRRTSAQGRTDISILKAAGFRVEAMASHPLVRDRNNTVNARFCAADGVTRRLFVDPACAKSIEVYERHVYKEGSNDPDKSGGFDHLPDSLGYYAHRRYGDPKVRMNRELIM